MSMNDPLTPEDLALLNDRRAGETFTDKDRRNLTKLIKLAGDRLERIATLEGENRELEDRVDQLEHEIERLHAGGERPA